MKILGWFTIGKVANTIEGAGVMSAPWDHISNINLELVIVQTDCIYLNYKCHYGSWTIMRIMTTNMIGQLQHLLDLLTFSY